MGTRPFRILLHISGCLGFLAIPVLFSPDINGSRSLFTIPPFQRDFFHYLMLIGFFYLNYFLLIPELYFRRRYFYFIAALFVSLFITDYLPALLFHDGPPPPGLMKMPFNHPPPGNFRWIGHVSQFVSMLIFSLFLQINARWKKVEKEKVSAELSYLKAQINPHFLFNTLNSIYSLAIQRSDETPNAVVKLSEMMRYVTTESGSESVSLEKELNYVSNYIDLQQLRLGDTVQVTYKVEGPVLAQRIAPLVLIPFVENAFKYGVNPEEECFIDMHITVTAEELVLRLTNKIANVNFSSESHSGHGLQNAEKRLNLIYPGRHRLAVTKNNGLYTIDLNLRLC